ncbi:MAG: DUF1292 domain-containing protein [Bacilli bacterium]|nr:DUF1292 domain-containing protein [Bacilli bacterium]
MPKNKNKNYFTYIDNEGNEIECRILYTFDLEETKKNYIVYTDETLDENGKYRTYASTYDPDKELSDLGPIETEKEWKLIEGILSNLTKEDK